MIPDAEDIIDPAKSNCWMCGKPGVQLSHGRTMQCGPCQVKWYAGKGPLEIVPGMGDRSLL